MSDHIAPLAAQPDWARIRETEFLYEDQCWLTCGGGYCCGAMKPAEFDFRILPTGGAAISYIDDEYDWMEAHGAGPLEEMRRRTFTFDFGGPRPLKMVVVDCTLKGMCNDCMIKPMMCRIYPFVPIFDIEGELTDLYPSSVYDLTFLRRDESTPCTVWHRKRDQYLERYRASSDVDVLRNPKLMFYFAAYKCFADFYLDTLEANAALAPLKGSEFWARWELLYLGRKLFDTPAIKAGIHALYERYRERYGDFF